MWGPPQFQHRGQRFGQHFSLITIQDWLHEAPYRPHNTKDTDANSDVSWQPQEAAEFFPSLFSLPPPSSGTLAEGEQMVEWLSCENDDVRFSLRFISAPVH